MVERGRVLAQQEEGIDRAGERCKTDAGCETGQVRGETARCIGDCSPSRTEAGEPRSGDRMTSLGLLLS